MNNNRLEIIDNDIIHESYRQEFCVGKEVKLICVEGNLVRIQVVNDGGYPESQLPEICMTPEEFTKLTGQALLSTIPRHSYFGYGDSVVVIDKVLSHIYKGQELEEVYLIDKESFEKEQKQIFKKASRDLAQGLKNGSYAVKSPMKRVCIDITRRDIEEAYKCTLCDTIVAKDGTGKEECPKHNTSKHFSEIFVIKKALGEENR